MQTENPKTILFITGAFVSNESWNDWRDFYEAKGYKTIAPPWPHKNDTAEKLRQRHPDPEVAGIRLQQLIEYFEEIAGSLAEKPIIIGHSLGGLIGQILNQKGLAAAVVAIHSVPPQGIMSFKFSFLKAGWGPLGFFTSSKKTFLMSFSQWQYAFTNGLSFELQKKGYEELAIPESKLVVRDTITAVAKVDFSKPHRPLLFIAGDNDHTIPYQLNQQNFKKYTDKNSVTNYKLFSGRNHFVLGQPGWQEIAIYILNWLDNVE
ncbi:Pimeloyl-ACP methyl ester carboxylesterase [Flavobacterium aquidurense]|uniref:Alpha/beta hydrolase n=1 Tax=Flavobacterium frigidimaris TaxID=262320 RepID=A0ABX4BWT1_FLAFR|nr:alpha/beta hydrolase [Flavobacterium frigidimaris]OXA82131.1 alpha/beta hydrolase [Flavobacterium frigidimaris]SDY51427.1 Pimeloyl-ACP methyl ester carboxylesterase [Flavobacterium aquidurense]